MNRTVVATATLGLLGCSAAQSAGDAGRGKEVAATCAPCHGLDGVSPSPAFPILAGQHEIYLANSIRAYQSGQRPDAVMGGSVRTLTEKQIEDVAAYYAAQKGLAVAREERKGPNTAALAATATAGAEATALTAGVAGAADKAAGPGARRLDPRGSLGRARAQAPESGRAAGGGGDRAGGRRAAQPRGRRRVGPHHLAGGAEFLSRQQPPEPQRRVRALALRRREPEARGEGLRARGRAAPRPRSGSVGDLALLVLRGLRVDPRPPRRIGSGS